MAMQAGEVKQWLNTLADDTLVAINDDGLALEACNDEGSWDGEVYLEIGGTPLPGEDDER